MAKTLLGKESFEVFHKDLFLGPLLFLIYINDLPDGLSSNCKLFADDMSLFSIVHDLTISSSELYSDLAKISEWAFK